MAQGEKTVTDDEIIQWMRNSVDPAFTTAELAQNFDMSVEGMRGRLNELHDDNRLYRKKPTSRAVIWWTDTDHERSALSK